jgi:hypothetical protein
MIMKQLIINLILISKLLGLWRDFKSTLVNMIDINDFNAISRNGILWNSPRFSDEFCIQEEKFN